jgi:hypothetical protein
MILLKEVYILILVTVTTHLRRRKNPVIDGYIAN